jgi:hypothetical protein
MPACPNCGGRVGQGARFCPYCGVSQRPPGTPAPAPAQQGAVVDRWELCEISWWRGYVRSEFCANAVGADGTEYEVGRSRPFRWRRAEPPPADHPDARPAHEAFVSWLTERGWEPIGDGFPWYALRFRRHAAGLRVLAGEVESAGGEEDSAGA